MIRLLASVALTGLFCFSVPASAQIKIGTKAAQQTQRGWLGITVEEDAAKSRVVVVEVVPASPAYKAGLKPGDVIVAVMGKKLKGFDAFLDLMSKGRVGQRFVFQVLRGAKAKHLDVVLGPRPGAKPAKPKPASHRSQKQAPAAVRHQGYLGVELEADGKRVAIVRVAPGTAAAIAGLKVGDRVTAVNGTPIAGLDDLIQRVRKLHAGDQVRLSIRRRGDGSSWQQLVLTPKLGRAMPASRVAIEKPKAQLKRILQVASAPKAKLARKAKSAKKPVALRRNKVASHPQAGSVIWHKDFAKAVASSRDSGLPLVILFCADWCRSCQMLGKSLAAPAMRPYLSGAVLVKIDVDKQGKLAKGFGVHGVPYLVVRNAKGRTVGTLTGYLEASLLKKRLGSFLKKAGWRPRSRLGSKAGAGQPTGSLASAEMKGLPAGLALVLRKQSQQIQELQRQLLQTQKQLRALQNYVRAQRRAAAKRKKLKKQ
ncbi:MAG: hypothetical protein CSA62_01140 [Planctomycetota bacterium]|nr:MAG: hypothetical protein CSA62_01140 [Planctomycetota bacterium]